MKVLLLPDGLKPAEFSDRSNYLTAYNAAPLRVGDVISVPCKNNGQATITAIWFTIARSGPYLPVTETETGHKHIIAVDQPLGPVTHEKTIDLTVESRAD